MAITAPVPRPKPGDDPLLWYLDTKPRFYRPYLIRVLNRDDTSMEFVFLDGSTGEDLALSKESYQIAYHDGRYAYSALPSTAQNVRLGSTRSCGLLFISDLYMQSLARDDRDVIIESITEDNKWPRSLGKLARPTTRRRTALKDDHSAQEPAHKVSKTAPRHKRRKRAS
jgi:hypothetical protein